jgi:hypothetical protein
MSTTNTHACSPFRRLAAGALVLGLAGALVPTTRASAGVKLITLPPRERVEIQLDHPGATLVEEERFVPLEKGLNEVVFAWTNTSIDPQSIQFRCLTDPERIRVVSVSYPPDGAQLTWQVGSPAATTARVRISYVIGRLDKSFAYRAVAARDESTLELWQYFQLHNSANEAFGEAGMSIGFGDRLERPIGASETKQILAAHFTEVPITKRYTADLAQYGYLDPGKRQLRVPMHYVLANTEKGKLGRFPLMPGKARIFQMASDAGVRAREQDDGGGTAAFLGEDWAGYTPRGKDLALFLGVAKDVVVTRTIERSERKPRLGALYDHEVVVKYEIENFKDVPAVLDLTESLTALRAEVIGHTGRTVEWQLGDQGTLRDPDPARSGPDRPLFHLTLAPRGADQQATKVVATLHVIIKNEW